MLSENFLSPEDVSFFECNLCGMRYSMLESMKNHVQLVHKKLLKKDGLQSPNHVPQPINIKIKCMGCVKTLKSLAGLKNHCKYKHSELSRTCYKCEKVCDTINELVEHQTRKCKNICSHCGTYFLNKKELNNHLLFVHQVKLLKCAFCHECYQQEKFLRIHQQFTHFLGKKMLSNRTKKIIKI